MRIAVVFLLVCAIFAGLSQTQSAHAIDDLVAHWTFDEGGGTTAFDSSGNSFDGTLVNTTYSSTVPDVAFPDPYSANFDSEQSGRVITTNLSLDNYTQFTMAGWAYPTAASTRSSWFGQNDLFEFGFTDGDTLVCYTQKGSAHWDFNPSTFLNHWHNITCLATDTDLIVYVDGTNVASTPISAGSFGTSGDHFSIGAGAMDGGSSGPFTGLIDDVRVYSRGLTPEEMEALGEGQPGPGELPSIDSLSPIDDATDVAVDSNLEINFADFTDFIGRDTGNIIIHKTSDDSVVESIDVNSGQVTANGSSGFIIDPSVALAKGTSYYVTIDPTAFYDGGDDTKYFAGIDNNTTWNFTTIGDGPAGVGDGLRLWLTASKGVKNGSSDATNGQGVDTWEDQSTSERDATKSSTAATFTSNGLNFNPTIDFTNDNYEASNTGLATGTQDRSIFVVASVNSNGWRYVLGAGSGPGSQAGFDFGHEDVTANVFLTNHNSAQVSTGSWLPYGGARLAYGALDNQYMYLSVNGATPVLGTGPDEGAVSTTFNGPLNIGANSAGLEYWDGNISEVIFYNRVVTPEERQRITSYLALKYGFSLDQSSPQSYLANGSAVMWDKDAPNASTYNQNLFGIGRDDESGLSQVKSKGQAASGVITLEAVDEGTNTQPAFNDLDNLEFLVVGDNGGSAAWTATGAPAGYKILQRAWDAQEQGDVGDVNYTFDVDDSDFNIPASETGTYYIITDTDGDGSLADETPIAMTNTSGSNWQSSIDIDDGTLFTIASIEQPKIDELSPDDNSTGASRTTNLVMTFDRAVTVGSGNIVIHKSSDDSVVETIAANNAKVTGSTTNTITINPSTTLDYDTSYYVIVDDNAFAANGQYFEGIGDTTGWNFTTAPDTDVPYTTQLSPADDDNDVSINSNLVMTFSENVSVDSGDIVIKKASDDSVVETIDVTGDQLTGDGTDTITIDPADPLMRNSDYYVTVDATAFEDSANNYYAGIDDSVTWNFTTEDDHDGIDAAIENAAPNDGDANDDGILDSQQANVASFINPLTGKWIVLDVDAACEITSVTTSGESSTTPDNQFDYPNGMLTYTLDCGSNGYSTHVNISYFDVDPSGLTTRKYDPNHNTYSTIDSAELTTSSIDDHSVARMSYVIADGNQLDTDAHVNGLITDPVGLGQAVDIVSAPQSDALPATGTSIVELTLAGLALLLAGFVLKIRPSLCRKRVMSDLTVKEGRTFS
jgi:hypothetical protein